MQFLLFIVLSIFLHDIHVSKSEVEYNPEAQALQISTHIYIDDLELDIQKLFGTNPLFIGTKKEVDSADYYIYQYLQEYLVFNVNEEPVAYDFIGKELSEDLLAIWVYLEVPGIESIQSITMQYDVLMELYDDQKNIMSLRTPVDGKSFYLFHNKHKVESVSF